MAFLTLPDLGEKNLGMPTVSHKIPHNSMRLCRLISLLHCSVMLSVNNRNHCLQNTNHHKCTRLLFNWPTFYSRHDKAGFPKELSQKIQWNLLVWNSLQAKNARHSSNSVKALKENNIKVCKTEMHMTNINQLYSHVTLCSFCHSLFHT